LRLPIRAGALPDNANATLLRQECGIGIVPIEVIHMNLVARFCA